MYLSAFTLDRHASSVRQCLADCHDMHRTIMKGFGQYEIDKARSSAGVLYRLSYIGSKINLYVLSKDLPDWSYMVRQGFLPREENTKNISALEKAFSVGTRFSFDLLASPTKKQPWPGKNSRRVLLKTAVDREEWLNRKALQNGFKIEYVREDGQIKIKGKSGGEISEMWQTGVFFRGLLSVVTPELFRKAFTQGIGSGKAYGFGLLMLMPPEV